MGSNCLQGVYCQEAYLQGGFVLSGPIVDWLLLIRRLFVGNFEQVHTKHISITLYISSKICIDIMSLK